MNIICKLFGHRPSEDTFYNANNIDCCGRCGETRAFYHTGHSFFTNFEWMGIIGYSIWKIKTLAQWLIWPIYYKIKYKIKYKKDNDELPF